MLAAKYHRKCSTAKSSFTVVNGDFAVSSPGGESRDLGSADLMAVFGTVLPSPLEKDALFPACLSGVRLERTWPPVRLGGVFAVVFRSKHAFAVGFVVISEGLSETQEMAP